MEKMDFDKKNLRKFGITMGWASLIIALLILIRHKHSILPVSIISGVFFIIAFIAPIVLKPVYIFWMKLALILNWANTRLILFIIFYFIITPIGLVMRLFGGDLLDRKIEKHKESYWREKDKDDFGRLNYERQF